MLDSLSDRLNTIFRKLKGHGKLTEKNIEEGLKEVRMALLEADVHYRVVKGFIADVKERAMGQEVLESLTPGQQVIKIVNETLTELMGARHEALNLSGTSPVAVMLVGGCVGLRSMVREVLFMPGDKPIVDTPGDSATATEHDLSGYAGA